MPLTRMPWRPMLDREAGGEVRDRGLHRAVDRLARVAAHALDRVHVDDRTAAALDHRVEERAGHREEVAQVDLVHRVPRLGRRPREAHERVGSRRRCSPARRDGAACSATTVVGEPRDVVVDAARRRRARARCRRAASISVDLALGALGIDLGDLDVGAVLGEEREIAPPMPSPPPVTTATLPSSSLVPVVDGGDVGGFLSHGGERTTKRSGSLGGQREPDRLGGAGSEGAFRRGLLIRASAVPGRCSTQGMARKGKGTVKGGAPRLPVRRALRQYRRRSHRGCQGRSSDGTHRTGRDTGHRSGCPRPGPAGAARRRWHHRPSPRDRGRVGLDHRRHQPPGDAAAATRRAHPAAHRVPQPVPQLHGDPLRRGGRRTGSPRRSSARSNAPPTPTTSPTPSAPRCGSPTCSPRITWPSTTRSTTTSAGTSPKASWWRSG